jgi:endothelin-converting enzyme
MPSLVTTAAAPSQSNVRFCTTPICNEVARHLKSGLARNYRELNPCDDFDAYTCNGWRDTHDFEQDQSSLSPMSVLTRQHQDVLRVILENTYAENNSFTGTQKDVDRENFYKLKTAYDTCMNEDKIKEAGIVPLANLLNEFEMVFPRNGGAVSAEDLARVHSWLLRRSSAGFIGASTGVSSCLL